MAPSPIIKRQSLFSWYRLTQTFKLGKQIALDFQKFLFFYLCD